MIVQNRSGTQAAAKRATVLLRGHPVTIEHYGFSDAGSMFTFVRMPKALDRELDRTGLHVDDIAEMRRQVEATECGS